ncbi:MAG: sugar phosphate isomerase/epimerase family protein [Limisphaerales bacterium]
MQLGLGSYTFTWAIGVPGQPPPRPMSAMDLLTEATRLGVRVVQCGDNLPLTQLPARELEAFETKARARELKIELGTRGLDRDNLRANLKLAQRLGASFLRLVIDRPGDEPSPEETVARLRPLLPECERLGVRLAIENHDRFPSATLARMIEDLGRDRVGICLDTVNSFGALEGPEVVVERLGEFTLCLHVKDFVVRRVSHQMGFVIEGCAAGQGRLDVPWLLKTLEKGAPRFNAILETWVPPGDSIEETLARERAWTEQGVRYLRGLIKD